MDSSLRPSRKSIYALHALETLESRLLLATFTVPDAIPRDYSRDVTADLQNFFNSVPDNSTIAFPNASYDHDTVGYKVEGTLTIAGRHGLDFEGNGAFIRAFDPVSTGGSVAIRTRSQWRSNNSSTNLIWRNFILYGANSGHAYDATREAQHGFDIVGSSNGILIDNVQIFEPLGDGVYIGGSNTTQNVTVQNCHIQYNGRQGMAVAQGNNILIQNNWIGDSSRGIIDIEPYAAGWGVDNVRILNNTFGTSRLLTLPMSGAGDYGTVYIGGNVTVGTNGVPEVAYDRSDAATRRGPFILVNNDFHIGGSPAAGIRLQPVDGSFIAGNDTTFPAARSMTGLTLTDSPGAAIVDNLFEDAATMYTADAASPHLMDITNTTTRTDWSRQTTVTEFASNPGAYSATTPDGSGGQVIAIWRVNASSGTLSFGGLTTTGDYAVVHLNAAGGFVDGWGFNLNAKYNGQTLPLLRPLATPTATATATDPNAAEQPANPGTLRVSRSTWTGNLLVNYTLGGTASSGDYTPALSGSVTIPDGQSYADITITPAADALNEGSETLSLTLAAGSGYTADTPNSATVTIADQGAAQFTHSLVALGRDIGGDPTVPLFRDGSQIGQVQPFDSGFLGGVRLAMGDLTGDGIPDIICGTGPGAAHVRVLDGDTAAQIPGPLGSFLVYPGPGNTPQDPNSAYYTQAFTGGLFVASGDVDGDGRADLITAADAGAGPHVKVYSGATGAMLRSFWAFDQGFQGGVRIAAGDLDGDGHADIICGSGVGAAHVRIYSGATGNLLPGAMGSFLVYPGQTGDPADPASDYYRLAFQGGIFVASGDVDGDGRDDLITGAGAGGGPHVKVYSGQSGSMLASFWAYDQAFQGGARVAAGDVNGDGRDDILTATGPAASQVRAFNLTDFSNPAMLEDFLPYNNDPTGLWVAGEA